MIQDPFRTKDISLCIFMLMFKSEAVLTGLSSGYQHGKVLTPSCCPQSPALDFSLAARHASVLDNYR